MKRFIHKILLGLVVVTAAVAVFFVFRKGAVDVQAAPISVLQFGTTGTSAGQFDAPEGIALDTSGNIYVADYSNNRIQKFDSSGNFLRYIPPIKLDPIVVSVSPVVPSAGVPSSGYTPLSE